MAVPENTGAEQSGNSVIRFLNETKSELKKVTWPTKQELISHTVVVLIAVVFSSALIWIIDFIISALFSMILR